MTSRPINLQVYNEIHAAYLGSRVAISPQLLLKIITGCMPNILQTRLISIICPHACVHKSSEDTFYYTTILDYKYTTLGMELVGGIPDSIGHLSILCYTESKVYLV